MEYKIYKNVNLGSSSKIGPWCEIGVPPKGKDEGDLSLRVGGGAIIRSFSVIYAGSEIGDSFTTGHGAIIQTAVKIGNRVSIGSHSEIEHDVVIGNDVRVHSGCFVAQGTVLGDRVRLSPLVSITSTKHPLLPEKKKNRRGPHIEEGVYVGIGAVIMSHITIGKGSLIAAGAVVTKDVPAGAVVLGNPAKVHMSVEEYMEKLRTKGVG